MICKGFDRGFAEHLVRDKWTDEQAQQLVEQELMNANDIREVVGGETGGTGPNTTRLATGFEALGLPRKGRDSVGPRHSFLWVVGGVMVFPVGGGV
jgi:hypothetical protein